jgi:hypothetical protein
VVIAAGEKDVEQRNWQTAGMVASATEPEVTLLDEWHGGRWRWWLRAPLSRLDRRPGVAPDADGRDDDRDRLYRDIDHAPRRNLFTADI